MNANKNHSILKLIELFCVFFVALQSLSQDTQLKILDILNWIFYNQFSSDTPHLAALKDTFYKYLDKFLLSFYLYGTRSTSRKATTLLSFLITKQNDQTRAFGEILLEKLLSLLNFLPDFESSAAMNWYFMLLHQVMSINAVRTYEACMRMLTVLSRGQKYNPFYALLKMRYNFSCLIFESQLFDVDLYLKFDLANQKGLNSSGINGNGSNAGSNMHHHQQTQQTLQQQPQFMQNANNYSFSFGTVGLSASNNAIYNINQPMSSYNPSQAVFYNTNGHASGQNVSNNLINLLGLNLGKEINLMPQCLGLVEVLPLNFKCLSSSNGTSVDKSNMKQEKSLYVLPDCFSVFGNNSADKTRYIDLK